MTDAAIKNFGWMNDWKVTPLEVQACWDKGHRPPSLSAGCGRCLTVTRCEECRYEFQVDSGD